MRLIDADNISFYCNYEGDCTGDINDCKKCGNYICNFRDIQEQPTAYSIDKVVEKLEENASRYTKKYVTPYGNNGYRDVKAISIHKAIEIVKQGGVADYVCEWKQDSMCEKVYRVCGGCFTSAYQKDFEFCPYCGERIKLVE